MSLMEASFFYNDFSALIAEVDAAELCENVRAIDTPEEISTCFHSSNDL